MTMNNDTDDYKYNFRAPAQEGMGSTGQESGSFACAQTARPAAPRRSLAQGGSLAVYCDRVCRRKE